MTRRILALSLVAGAALASSAAWSQTPPPAHHGHHAMQGDSTAVLVGSGPNGVGGAVVTVERATITAIDPATRMVTLQAPSGATFSIHAGEEVRNFDQLKVGDRVVSRQTEALLLGLRKVPNGIRQRTDFVDLVGSAPGGRPGLTARHVVQAVANVTAVDAKAGTVTLRGVNETRTIKVSDRALLATLSVGDQVEATMVDQEAISVLPPRAAH